MTDAKEMRRRNLESITAPIGREMKHAGITTRSLLRGMREELDYEEPIRTPEGVILLRTPAAMRVRQNARMDGHKMLAHYPAEKLGVDLKGNVIFQVIDYGDKGKTKKGKGGNGSKG